jgi:hypothetical protein
MAQTPQQVQELLTQIEAIYRRIGETNPFRNFDARAFNDVNDAVQVLEQGLVSGKRKLNELVNDAGELVSSFRAIVSEVKAGNIALTTTTKSFNGLTSIASKMQSDQAGINVLRKKELQSLQKQFEQEQLNLETNREALGLKAQELAQKKRTQGLTAAEERELLKVQSAHRATVSLMHDQDSAMAELNRKLRERLEREENIEKAMGLGGAAVGATGAALNKLGLGGLADKLGLDAVNEKMREMAETAVANGEETDKFGTKMKILKGGIKEAGKNLIENLKDPLAITTFLAKEFVDALLGADKATGELAKGFNMSYQSASNLRGDLNTIANLSADVNVNTAGLQESMVAIGKTLGSNVKLNQQDLVTFTKLREQAGMSNEELASIQKLTLATGGNLQDNTGEFLAQAQITAQNNGVVLNTKQLLSETVNVSDAIKLSLGGSAGELAKAAATAKSLGMTLDQIDKISESLLDFESSIGSELEAELLTGKDLTLEKARQAALNGDLVTVGEEISNQLGSAAEFTKMNRIQQEALAKSVGMSREDLAKTLVEREALVGLSGEEAKAGKETFDSLVKRYDVETATKMIREKGFKTLMDQQSIQERFNKGIEKLRDLFIGLAQPVLSVISPLIDLVNNILPLINVIFTPVLYTVQAIGNGIGQMVGYLTQAQDVATVLAGTFGAILAFKNRSNIATVAGIALDKTRALLAKREAGVSLAQAALGAIKSVVQTPFIGPLLAAAAAAGVYALGKSYLSKGDDVVSPGYGKRTLMAPEGAIALNDKDTVIAGTNLGGGEKSSSGVSMPSIDLAPLVAEMQNVRAVLQQILVKEGSVYIDSTKAGTAFAVGTSKL